MKFLLQDGQNTFSYAALNMSTPYLKPRPAKRISLKEVVRHVQADGQVTIVFGAGISVAMGGKSASWTAFLESLISEVNKRHVSACCSSPGMSHWVGAEALNHRLHTIRSLAHGDSDAAAASTYLIDRAHAIHSGGIAKTKLTRDLDVNATAFAIEEAWISRTARFEPEVLRWNALLALLGDKAKKGRSFLVTTNFDHSIARAASLPIFLGGWSSPVGHSSSTDYYKAQLGGVVIRDTLISDEHLWTDVKIDDSNSLGTSPQLFADAWQNPKRISRHWWNDLASVFHVHGSRLVPPSVIFDACSYGKLCEGTPLIPSGKILRSLVDSPSISGPVIFAGCKGTLIDPHFIRYWSNTSAAARFYVLQKEDEIDPLEREMYGCNLSSPPAFCSFGSAHSDLLKALEQIAQALP